MVDFSFLRDEFGRLVDQFKADAHTLFTHVESQAEADTATVAEQATEDVSAAATDVAHNTVTPPPSDTPGA